jgi:hypothetical protein
VKPQLLNKVRTIYIESKGPTKALVAIVSAVRHQKYLRLSNTFAGLDLYNGHLDYPPKEGSFRVSSCEGKEVRAWGFQQMLVLSGPLCPFSPSVH